MRKIILSLLFTLLFTGCVSLQNIPTPTAEQKQRIYNSDLETVWSKAIKLVTDEGLPIKAIEKSSGLLQTDFMFSTYKWYDVRYSFNFLISAIDTNTTKVIFNPHSEIYYEGEWKQFNEEDKLILEKYFKLLDNLISSFSSPSPAQSD